MFTGIISKIGTIKSVQENTGGLSLEIEAGDFLNDLHAGASIAIDGVCLTATRIENGVFSIDAIKETISKTTISVYRVGTKVNLEKPLRFSDGLDGHLVQGHIDGTGAISKIEKKDENLVITFKISGELSRGIVEKGSIAIDGISLTVVAVAQDTVSAALIPYTIENTTLGKKNVGNKVNIETDIIGKYVVRYFSGIKNSKSFVPFI